MKILHNKSPQLWINYKNGPCVAFKPYGPLINIIQINTPSPLQTQLQNTHPWPICFPSPQVKPSPPSGLTSVKLTPNHHLLPRIPHPQNQTWYSPLAPLAPYPSTLSLLHHIPQDTHHIPPPPNCNLSPNLLKKRISRQIDIGSYGLPSQLETSGIWSLGPMELRKCYIERKKQKWSGVRVVFRIA